MEPTPLDPFLETLDQVVLSHMQKPFFQRGLEDLEDLLVGPVEKVFVPLPVPAFGGLPKEIQSARLFGLRAGASGPRERHPNSHQWVVSVAGAGQIRVWTVEETASVIHALESDPKGTLCSRWSAVPPGLWHRPSAGPADRWIALALHTSGEGILIDEYDETWEDRR